MVTPNRAAVSTPTREAPSAEQTVLLALDAVAKALAGLRYGTVALTVHDGRVVQLEVTERQRFT